MESAYNVIGNILHTSDIIIIIIIIKKRHRKQRTNSLPIPLQNPLCVTKFIFHTNTNVNFRTSGTRKTYGGRSGRGMRNHTTGPNAKE
jgi:hypothetical protein